MRIHVSSDQIILTRLVVFSALRPPTIHRFHRLLSDLFFP
jgi:hypothetical protein